MIESCESLHHLRRAYNLMVQKPVQQEQVQLVRVLHVDALKVWLLRAVELSYKC